MLRAGVMRTGQREFGQKKVIGKILHPFGRMRILRGIQFGFITGNVDPDEIDHKKKKKEPDQDQTEPFQDSFDHFYTIAQKRAFSQRSGKEVQKEFGRHRFYR